MDVKDVLELCCTREAYLLPYPERFRSAVAANFSRAFVEAFPGLYASTSTAGST